MSRPGAFLDRDGTIVTDTGFLRDPEAVALIPGAARAIEALARAGFVIVVVTNQSGIARGIVTPDDYRAVAGRIETLLARDGARLDATYVCPHYPEISGPCDCRKPGLAHYRDAADRLGLDLHRSVFIGDRLSDVEPATSLGGRGILVLTGEGASHQVEATEAGFEVAADLEAAAKLVLSPGLY